jgi:cephalosporin-C deacetylase-like acetyl esterase
MGETPMLRKIAMRHRLLLTFLFAAFAPCSSVFADPLPNTAPLSTEGDLAAQMVAGIDKFCLRKIDESIDRRAALWKRDFSSQNAYAKSIEPNRKRLAQILGVVEARIPFEVPEIVASVQEPVQIGRGDGFEAYAVRWPVIGGIYGEGILLRPVDRKPIADVVAIPDADQTPEELCGFAAGRPPHTTFARRLAEAGCRVIIPVLISRDDTFSMPPSGQKTNQPHREYVYRPAYEMGRHVIGYEVQKVLAAVDWFHRPPRVRGFNEHEPAPGPTIVAGYGEGGMIALYAGALDERISVTAVSGYFSSRQELWREPIYRNVFGLLAEFGDAEIASMICPRSLVIDKAAGPKEDGPPSPRDGRKGAAPGVLTPADPRDVGKEVARLLKLTDGPIPPFAFVVNAEDGEAFGDAALSAILRKVGGRVKDGKVSPPVWLAHREVNAGFADRQRRMIEQMQAHTQQVVRDAEQVRKAFWSKADVKSRDPEKFKASVEPYRKRFYDEVIGRFDDKLLPANPRTRLLFETPKVTAYEVMLDVFPDVFAYGVLVMPKDLKPGERRPVVVCQHGLEGRPTDTTDTKNESHFYHAFATRLAERGFITYAPQNPYIGQDKFRTLQRKLNPLGKTLFSIIIPQHQQTTDWLATLPFVDPQRIAFYGLSYGGKSAMRIPPLVDRYCLSICSGDFNEWTWKCTSITFAAGYPGTNEYEMFEWDLGNTFGYAEMAALIAPRPFMVERGHRDGVSIDEWVAYEYAKVRRLYADLKIPERTEIEFFDGPHTIHGEGTFKFLHKHLNWPEPKN